MPSAGIFGHHKCTCRQAPLSILSPRSPTSHPADRHGYDPFVLELDFKPFGAHQPKITLQVGRSFPAHIPR